MLLVLLEMNLLMNGFYDCDYVILKLKVQEIEFYIIFVIGYLIKF